MMMMMSTVADELATLTFSACCPPVTGSPILPSPLWNPEAVKQIVKWHVSTFRQTLKPRMFFPSSISFTPPGGWNLYQHTTNI